jgi:predicted unusual protein kinase regulating ubiquinone biosynthesis (AarF/ABC1/UbiB family)
MSSIAFGSRTAFLSLLLAAMASQAHAKRQDREPIPDKEAKRTELRKMEESLKADFPARDEAIEQLMTGQRIIMLRPHVLKKPRFSFWLSEPGALKTSLITEFHKEIRKRFGKYQDVETKLYPVTIAPGTLEFPIEVFKEADGKGIVYVNEIQNLVSFEEIENTIARLRSELELEGRDMGHSQPAPDRWSKHKDEDEEERDREKLAPSNDKLQELRRYELARAQRLEAEHYLWELTATGKIPQSSKATKTMIANVVSTAESYLAARDAIERANKQVDEMAATTAPQKKAEADTKFDAFRATFEGAEPPTGYERDVDVFMLDDLLKPRSIKAPPIPSGGDSPELTPPEPTLTEPQKTAWKAFVHAAKNYDSSLYAIENDKKVIAAETTRLKSEYGVRVEDYLRRTLSERPDLFDFIEQRSAETRRTAKEIFEIFQANPDHFLSTFQEFSRGATNEGTKNGKELQVIFDGNIEDTIGAPARAEFDAGPEKSPDAWRRIVNRKARPEVVAQFVLSKFSKRQGWATRLGLSTLRYIAPTDARGLMDAARKRLKQEIGDFRQEMREEKIKTKILVDASLNPLFAEAASDATGQFRALSTTWDTFFEMIFTNGPEAVINLRDKSKDKAAPDSVKIAYNEKSRTVRLIAHWNDPQKRDRAIVKYKVPRIHDLEMKPTSEADPHLTEAEAFHQAGHVLLGSLMMGSVPSEVSLPHLGRKSGTSDLWSDQAESLLRFQRSAIYSVVGGILSERLLAEPGRSSNSTKEDLDRAIQMATRYVNLVKRDVDDILPAASVAKKSGRSHAPELVRETDLGAEGLAEREQFEQTPYFQRIGDEKVRRELAGVFVLVSRSLLENQGLVERLVEHLVENESIGSGEIKRIFESRGKKIAEPLLSRILKEKPGTLTQNLPDAFEGSGNPLGRIWDALRGMSEGAAPPAKGESFVGAATEAPLEGASAPTHAPGILENGLLKLLGHWGVTPPTKKVPHHPGKSPAVMTQSTGPRIADRFSRRAALPRRACIAAISLAVSLTFGSGLPAHAARAKAPAAQAMPSDWEQSSSALNASAAGGSSGGQMAIDLSADERLLARVALDGAFESDARKVEAFDHMLATLRGMSPGRLLDLSMDVLKKTDPRNPSQSVAMEDPEIQAAYRRTLEKLLESIWSGAGMQAVRSADDFLDQLRQGHIPDNLKTELIRRISLVDKVFGPEKEAAVNAYRSIDDFATFVATNPQLAEQVGGDLKKLRAVVGELKTSDDARDLAQKAQRLASSIDQSIADLLRGQAGDLGQAARESWSKLRELADRRGDSLNHYAEELRVILADLDSLPHSPEVRQAFERFLKLDLGFGNFDMKASLDLLGKVSSEEGVLARVRKLHETLASRPENAELGRFWSELSDLRAFLFRTDRTSKEYHRTVEAILAPIMQWEPGDSADSFATRLAQLQEAARASEFPDAVRERLTDRCRSLIDLARSNDAWIRSMMGDLRELKQKAGHGEFAGIRRELSRLFALQGPEGTEGVRADQKNALHRARAAFGKLQAPDEVKARMRANLDRLVKLSGETESWRADFTEALRTVTSSLQGGARAVDQATRNVHEWLNGADLTGETTLARTLSHVRHEARGTLNRLASVLEASWRGSPVGAQLMGQFRAMDQAVSGGIASVERLKNAELRLKGLAQTDPEVARILEHEIKPLFAVVNAIRGGDSAYLGNQVDALTRSAIGGAGHLHQTLLHYNPSRSSKIQLISAFEPLFQHCIRQIENISSHVAHSGQLKIDNKPFERFFNITMENYPKLIPFKFKKEMLSDLLALRPDAELTEQFGAVINASGPSVQKLIQVFSRDKQMAQQEIGKVLKVLESGAKAVPFETVHQLLLDAIPEIYPSRFESFDRKPLGVGTMAQAHRAKIRLDSGEVVSVVVRVNKPGMEERVNVDRDALSKIATLVAADPEVQGSPLQRIETFVDVLDRQVRVELRSGMTAKNQIRGKTAYSGTFKTKSSEGRKMDIRVSVPDILFPELADRGVIVMGLAKGSKIIDFFAQDSSSYAQVVEKLGETVLSQAILKDGFFQMDLHQGNILVSRDADGTFEVVILDFGMCDTLSVDHRAAYLMLDAAVESRDIEQTVRALRQLLENNLDEKVMRKVLADLLHQTAPGAWTTANVTSEIFVAGGNLPEAFVNFNRAVLLLDQILVDSKSPLTLGQLVSREFLKGLRKEAPHRLGDAIRRAPHARPAEGLPLSNAELGGVLGAHAKAKARSLKAKAKGMLSRRKAAPVVR